MEPSIGEDTQYEEILPEGVELTPFSDHAAWRSKIFGDVKSAVETSFPKTYGNIRLEVSDLDYQDPETYSLEDQKNALLNDKYLTRRLRGKLRLFDNTTDELLDEKEHTIMRVPYLTERGTFIHNGSEYVSLRQNRLRPGVYTRRKANGDLEAQFNIRRGTGPGGFRVRFEPQTGLYKMDIGQSSLRLYSLLHDLGMDDERIKEAWGEDIWKINKDGYDPRVFEKAYSRLAGFKAQEGISREEKTSQIIDILNSGRMDKEIVRKTLPNLYQSIENAKK